jgi:hypothetical protein
MSAKERATLLDAEELVGFEDGNLKLFQVVGGKSWRG